MVLLELHLRNLGVVAEAKVAFAPGLNVVTGETGAGKTLLVTSLALVTGGRAQARLVAHGAEEASVEVVVSPPGRLGTQLTELGVDDGSEVVLARRVSSDGRTRAWIDGRLVPLSVLTQLGERLIEVHGQGAGFALAHPAAQLEAIDALAGNDEVLAPYREALRRMKELAGERAELLQDERTQTREAELLTFQAEEIDRAGLRPGEDDAVAAELTRLEHAERLTEVAGRVLELAGAEGAAGHLAEAHRALSSVAAFDPELPPLISRLGAAAAEAAETAWDVRSWTDGLEGDPARLDSLRERKGLIGSLKRKYGSSVEEIIAAGEDARRRLTELEGASGRIAALAAAEDEARAEAEQLAAQLSQRRRKAARKLTKLVSAELPALALPQAVFEAECFPSDGWTENGRDRIALRFSESRERPPDLIGKVASGGELSRAMIAVTLGLARAHAVPVLVFDEADQGLGGEAALELARRLAKLGRTHQVLVVSHLPQIAAFADRHIAVRKNASGVEVEVVEETERLAEISRMLAGLESSELARGHAAELVELADRERTLASSRAS